RSVRPLHRPAHKPAPFTRQTVPRQAVNRLRNRPARLWRCCGRENRPPAHARVGGRYGTVGRWPASSCASRAALSPASWVASSFGLNAPPGPPPGTPFASAASRAALSPASCVGSSLEPRAVVDVVEVEVVPLVAAQWRAWCFLPPAASAAADRAPPPISRQPTQTI